MQEAFYSVSNRAGCNVLQKRWTELPQRMTATCLELHGLLSSHHKSNGEGIHSLHRSVDDMYKEVNDV